MKCGGRRWYADNMHARFEYVAITRVRNTSFDGTSYGLRRAVGVHSGIGFRSQMSRTFLILLGFLDFCSSAHIHNVVQIHLEYSGSQELDNICARHVARVSPSRRSGRERTCEYDLYVRYAIGVRLPFRAVLGQNKPSRVWTLSPPRRRVATLVGR